MHVCVWGGVACEYACDSKVVCCVGVGPQQRQGFHPSQCCPVVSGENDGEREGRVIKQTAACIGCE